MSRIYNVGKETYPRNAVYCGRGSPWGNKFRIGIDGDRDECCDKFELEVLPTLDVESLRGHDLLCHCVPLRCHVQSIVMKLDITELV